MAALIAQASLYALRATAGPVLNFISTRALPTVVSVVGRGAQWYTPRITVQQLVTPQQVVEATVAVPRFIGTNFLNTTPLVRGALSSYIPQLTAATTASLEISEQLLQATALGLRNPAWGAISTNVTEQAVASAGWGLGSVFSGLLAGLGALGGAMATAIGLMVPFAGQLVFLAAGAVDQLTDELFKALDDQQKQTKNEGETVKVSEKLRDAVEAVYKQYGKEDEQQWSTLDEDQKVERTEQWIERNNLLFELDQAVHAGASKEDVDALSAQIVKQFNDRQQLIRKTPVRTDSGRPQTQNISLQMIGLEKPLELQRNNVSLHHDLLEGGNDGPHELQPISFETAITLDHFLNQLEFYDHSEWAEIERLLGNSLTKSIFFDQDNF